MNMYMYMYMFMYMYMYMYMSTGYKANAYDAIPAALQRRVLQVSTAVVSVYMQTVCVCVYVCVSMHSSTESESESEREREREGEGERDEHLSVHTYFSAEPRRCAPSFRQVGLSLNPKP